MKEPNKKDKEHVKKFHRKYDIIDAMQDMGVNVKRKNKEDKDGSSR